MRSGSFPQHLRYKKSKTISVPDDATKVKVKFGEKEEKGEKKDKKAKKVAFSPSKARSILGEKKPTLQGHAITSKRRRWLGWQAGGAKKRKAVAPNKVGVAFNGQKFSPIKRIVNRPSLGERMKRYKKGSGKRFKIFKKALNAR